MKTNRTSDAVIVVLVALAVAVIGIGVYVFTHSGAPSSSGRGGTSNADTIALDSNLLVGSTFTVGTNGVTNSGIGVATQVTYGTCNVASTTPFPNVVNPFAATSTATLIALQLTGNATSTSFVMGTTTNTAAMSNTAAAVSSTMVNATVSTSTSYYVAGGITVGSGASYLSSGTGTFRSIVVGPAQAIGVYASSTPITLQNNSSFAGGYSACTYKIRWEN